MLGDVFGSVASSVNPPACSGFAYRVQIFFVLKPGITDMCSKVKPAGGKDHPFGFNDFISLKVFITDFGYAAVLNNTFFSFLWNGELLSRILAAWMSIFFVILRIGSGESQPKGSKARESAHISIRVSPNISLLFRC
jgi:hypothetical protein